LWVSEWVSEWECVHHGVHKRKGSSKQQQRDSSTFKTHKKNSFYPNRVTNTRATDVILTLLMYLSSIIYRNMATIVYDFQWYCSHLFAYYSFIYVTIICPFLSYIASLRFNLSYLVQ
jgi:hypothetical protein